MSEPMHVSDGAFEQTVLKATVPILVDFWAPWCGPCRMVAPSLERIAKEYAGRLLVVKVNTDENTEWAARYRVSGIPTMLFISGGQVVSEQVGALAYPSLKQMVDRFLAQVTGAATAAS